MIPIIAILVIATVVAIFEAPILIRNNYRKELWFFTIFHITGTSLLIIWQLHLQISSPFRWLAIVYKPFYRLMMGILS